MQPYSTTRRHRLSPAYEQQICLAPLRRSVRAQFLLPLPEVFVVLHAFARFLAHNSPYIFL